MRLTFSRRVLVGLVLGLATGLFLGDLVEPLRIVTDGFVRLLQMTVLPYVTLAIVTNLGRLSYGAVRELGKRVGLVLLLMWSLAILFACLVPLAFPPVESASFFSPGLTHRVEPFDLLDLYLPANPFHSLANSIVPAVVLFSILLGLALIGVDNRGPLLDVLDTATAAVGRLARLIVQLTPYGIFAIAAHAAGTLDVDDFGRIAVYLSIYIAFALLLSLWVIPGLIAALTPIGALESLAASRNALLTAFLVGDLFIVLPALMEACSELLERRLATTDAVRDLPASIIPTTFTFPHAGKLLSLSFVLFAAWFADVALPLIRYPQLVVSGFFSFFGSLNGAVPFLLDLFRVPADTFQLFLATGVINSRFGTLLAAVHTVAVGLLGSAAIAGALRVQPRRLIRFAVSTAVLTAAVIVGLRVGFATFLSSSVDGRTVLNSMQPATASPVDNALVVTPDRIAADTIPAPDRVLESIRRRGTLRVGLIGDGIPYAFRNDRNQLVGLDVEMALRLAADLGVGIQFVRFAQQELDEQVHRRTIDIVMTGARVTPERSASFATSVPYLYETMAIITRDHRRAEFRSWDAIRAHGGLRLGVQNLPYYITTVRELLPDAELSVIAETTELIQSGAPHDAYVLPAERGSVLTMLHPEYSVVVPDGAPVRMPLAYPIAGEDPAWTRYVNTWIDLKKGEGLVDRLYEQWILGRAAKRDRPRWSVIRNVLGWVG